VLLIIIHCQRGTSLVKTPKKNEDSSDSESDKESSNSSISLTDEKPKKHLARSSFISERKSFKVLKSKYLFVLK